MSPSLSQLCLSFFKSLSKVIQISEAMNLSSGARSFTNYLAIKQATINC